jgi:hypothetical protein
MTVAKSEIHFGVREVVPSVKARIKIALIHTTDTLKKDMLSFPLTK